MKNLSYTIIFFIFAAPSLFAQNEPKKDNRVFDYRSDEEKSAEPEIETKPDYKWSLRIYPLALATNARVEVGYNLTERWQTNLLAAYYYNIVDSRPGFILPEYFWLSGSGQELQASIEHRFLERSMAIGCRIGFLNFRSSEAFFDYYGYELPAKLEKHQFSIQFLMRWRQDIGKRFFVEETLGAGFWYKDKTLTAYQTPDQSGGPPQEKAVRNYTYTPLFRFSVNIGLGF